MTHDMNCMYIAGTVVPSKTKIAYHFSTLVLTYGQQHTLQIEPRDEYGNPTSNSVSLVDEVNYSVHVHPVRALTANLLFIVFSSNFRRLCICISIKEVAGPIEFAEFVFKSLFLAVPTVGHSGGGGELR